MIFIGIDDTDVVGTAGTNQLARAILSRLGPLAAGGVIARHQLLFDSRIPFTSKNGSASIQLPALSAGDVPRLLGVVRGTMRAWFIPGSDPGLCVASDVPSAVSRFGEACQREPMTKSQARTIAAQADAFLEGLGGSEQGIIGALAAVGLVATGNDGRVVHLASWPWPDAFAGIHTVADIRSRGVEEIRRADTGREVADGAIDIGKHLRPNLRDRRIVLLVEPGHDGAAPWKAVKAD